MAERPKGYGLTAETNAKIAAKYDSNLEREAVSWMEAVVGERLNRSEAGPDALKEALKDGQFLCKLANKLQPGAVKKINTSKMAFKQMENINFFLDFISSYGVAKGDQFQTVDLYEGNNMGQVVITIHGVGRLAQKHRFRGPTLGPKESDENRRSFTEEQLKAGQNTPSQQMGTNQVASQAGMISYGARRFITDMH